MSMIQIVTSVPVNTVNMLFTGRTKMGWGERFVVNYIGRKVCERSVI